MRVRLRPLTVNAVGEIEHWFDDPGTQVWLGARDWIRREVRLLDERPGTTHRGARVLRSRGWVAYDRDGAPVAYIGGDVYDRWVRYHGQGTDGPILTDADHRPSMAMTYLVDPARRRCGYGLAAVRAVIRHPEVADVQIFSLGIDVENHASRALAEAAGFNPVDVRRDHEDMLYYRYDRPCRLTPTR